MQFILYLSEFIIPLFVFYVVGFAVLSKLPVFDLFVKGAKDGLQVTLSIFPTLLGLMLGVGVLRASGFLDWLAGLLNQLTEPLGIPGALWPLMLVRPLSTSAATGLLLDIFKEYGVDSFLGSAASIMMSCTESIFYTMSVYFMSVKVTKTRYTLGGALLATVAGIVASLVLAGWMS